MAFYQLDPDILGHLSYSTICDKLVPPGPADSSDSEDSQITDQVMRTLKSVFNDFDELSYTNFLAQMIC